ncbi:MAG: DUF2807 domain-containing protein [Rhizomicrobium sp.]|jgi:uncharacterized protein YaiE (UPF0345 family)
MRDRIYPILIGAALAALICLPAKAGDPNWVNGPQRNFDIRSLKIDDVLGTVKIEVKEGGPAILQISGLKQRVDGISVKETNGTLSIKGYNAQSVWDWSHWFDFSYNDTKPNQLFIVLTIAKGTRVDVNDVIGKATIGNTEGEMRFSSAGSTESTIGNVSEAHISLTGSGKVTVGNVAGTLTAETAGSGDIKVGNAGKADADIAGSGSILVGRIAGPLKVDIAGSGDFTAASVNGPTDVDIAGSGSVSIAGGEANPLHVDIMGSGNMTFGGTAVDPEISAMGSGSVKLKAYRGKLSNDGMSNLKIGD